MADEEKAAKEAEEKAALEAEEKRIKGLSNDELIKENSTLRSENARRRLENKGLTDQQIAAKEAAEKAEKEAAEKNGEFEGLYKTADEKSKTLEGQLEKSNATLAKMLEVETANVPEKFRALIPTGDTNAALSWIATAKETKLFEKPGGPGVRDAGEHGKNSISRQEFDALDPAARQKHIKDGGKVH